MNEEILQRLSSIEQSLATFEAASQNCGGAAKVLISLVPLLGVILGSTLIFFFILWQYRLRKELILSGSYKPVLEERIRLVSLLVGLLSTTVGIPMTILFWAVDGLGYTLLGGLLPMAAGTGLILFYYLSGKTSRHENTGNNANS